MSMSRIAFLVSCALVPLLVHGCGRGDGGTTFVAKREPWRAVDEAQCLKSGIVRESRFVHTRSLLGGPSACGAEQPFEMSAALDGRIQLTPPAILRCPMIPAVDRWVHDVVAPAARFHFGVPLDTLKVAASYGCRPINHKWGAKLSEHGLANAIDISEFHLADGRKVSVKGGWWSENVQERAFLRAVHRGACDSFTTVLGPHADIYHRDHFHMDLARHGRDGTYRVCK